MLKVVTDKKEIDRHHQQLIADVKSALKLKDRRTIGYPGPGKNLSDVEVLHNNQIYFSKIDIDGSIPRFGHWFGDYSSTGTLSAIVELNVPKDNATGLVSGFFATDHALSVTYLMHSGKVGGGAKGVGKYNFLAFSDLRLTECLQQDGPSRFAIPVMALGTKDCARQAIEFTFLVRDFKSAVRDKSALSPQLNKFSLDLKEFYEEATGSRAFFRNNTVEYITNHGHVVRALNKWRSKTLTNSENTAKSVLVDLAVTSNGKISEVYEVKSDCSRSSLYGAIGQLITHAPNGIERFVVLPDGFDIETDVLAAMQRSLIAIIRYRLKKSVAEIIPPTKS